MKLFVNNTVRFSVNISRDNPLRSSVEDFLLSEVNIKMGKPSKLDFHPDRCEILELLKEGVTHREIVSRINARYPEGDVSRISTAAISRYINREEPIELPPSIEKDVKKMQAQKPKQEGPKQKHESSQKKAERKLEALEDISMSETLQSNLVSLVQLLPTYISEGRDAKEIKALSEATKVYYELLNTAKKSEDPTSDAELTYDDIKSVEAEFECYD